MFKVPVEMSLDLIENHGSNDGVMLMCELKKYVALYVELIEHQSCAPLDPNESDVHRKNVLSDPR
jgi:hypothetical protein